MCVCVCVFEYRRCECMTETCRGSAPRMRMCLPPSLPTPPAAQKQAVRDDGIYIYICTHNIACIYNIEHVRHIQQQRQQLLHPLQMLRQPQEVHVLEMRCIC
jgi:hypothetical protein